MAVSSVGVVMMKEEGEVVEVEEGRSRSSEVQVVQSLANGLSSSSFSGLVSTRTTAKSVVLAMIATGMIDEMIDEHRFLSGRGL